MKNLKNTLSVLLFTALAAGSSICTVQAIETVVEESFEQVEREQEQGFAVRMYAKAQRMVTAPVDYVFGEESSYAKTAFYGVVSAAVLATGAYGVYRYFYEKALTKQLEAHN